MTIDIFLVEGEKLVINEHILALPKLRAVYEGYDDPFPPLLFLRNMCDPVGPYANIEEDIKEETIYDTFPGDYTPEDVLIQDAREYLDKLYMSSTQRYYNDMKLTLEKLGKFARTATVTDGKNGNHTDLLNQVKGAAKTIVEFRQLEKIAEEELKKGRKRGDSYEAYDENEEDDD